jgi:hypothetical protein
MLLPSVRDRLRRLAARRKMGYQTLVQQYLQQCVHRDLDQVSERSLVVSSTRSSPDWSVLASVSGCQILTEFNAGSKRLVGCSAADLVQVILDITALHFRVESARPDTYLNYDVQEDGGVACRSASALTEEPV